MSFVYTSCQNGHRLKAALKLAGMRLPCPKCKDTVTVPAAAPTRTRSSLSDTELMRILGDVAPLPPIPEPSKPTAKPCPRCEGSVGVNSTVCSHCQCYIGPIPNFMRKMIPSVSTETTSAVALDAFCRLHHQDISVCNE